MRGNFSKYSVHKIRIQKYDEIEEKINDRGGMRIGTIMEYKYSNTVKKKEFIDILQIWESTTTEFVLAGKRSLMSQNDIE